MERPNDRRMPGRKLAVSPLEVRAGFGVLAGRPAAAQRNLGLGCDVGQRRSGPVAGKLWLRIRREVGVIIRWEELELRHSSKRANIC